MTAGFYKYEDKDLLYASTFVEGDGYVLVVDNKDHYTYPVNGWYWFDSEELARAFFAERSKDVVTQRQFRLSLLQVGIDPDNITKMLANDKAALIEWNYATVIDRQHPLVDQLGAALNKTPQEVDALFAVAKQL